MTGAGGLPEPGADEVLFLPLGGVGEIGMNVALYGHAGEWLMVDLGIMFGDETMPGVDVILPDLAAIVERRDRLAGLVLTHAHEDHLGAVAYLWPRLRCPIYATPFAAALLRRKLEEAGLHRAAPITVLPMGAEFQVGPFALEYVTVTHSIPEPNALAIRTKAGLVVHSGDWKIDPAPVIGSILDEAMFRRLGEEGVLALIGDSTNAMVPGSSGSEASLQDELTRVIGEARHRVFVGCFASNVARLETIIAAARQAGRRIALVGRSLLRIVACAKEAGYLADLPNFVDEEHVGFLDRDEVVIICTGSQGEPRAALARIAAGTHPHVVADAGDRVVFSSRTIPGNERAIAHLQGSFIRHGVEVVTGADRRVHVSGHPARDELKQLYGWLKPRFAIPVHGEPRHLAAHAELARGMGVEDAIVLQDGEALRLAVDGAGIVARVAAGRLAVDGKRLLPLDGEALKARQRMVHDGVAIVSLVLSHDGELMTDPQVTLPGLAEGGEGAEIVAEAVSAVRGTFAAMADTARANDAALRQAVAAGIRRLLRSRLGKRPLIEVHVARLAHGKVKS